MVQKLGRLILHPSGCDNQTKKESGGRDKEGLPRSSRGCGVRHTSQSAYATGCVPPAGHDSATQHRGLHGHRAG